LKKDASSSEFSHLPNVWKWASRGHAEFLSREFCGTGDPYDITWSKQYVPLSPWKITARLCASDAGPSQMNRISNLSLVRGETTRGSLSALELARLSPSRAVQVRTFVRRKSFPSTNHQDRGEPFPLRAMKHLSSLSCLDALHNRRSRFLEDPVATEWALDLRSHSQLI